MMKKIISIDQDKCVGCGLCANACQESAIQMVDGKAKLVREDYCDGLGNCLPVCPTEAITFIEKEVEVPTAVSEDSGKPVADIPRGCPGTNMKTLKKNDNNISKKAIGSVPDTSTAQESPSELMQWPVQINLVPVNAPYFDGADLLIAADCTAYAYKEFHDKLLKGRITIIGCPKLDPTDYSEKLTEIIKNNDIRSVTVARMEVPCCGGIQLAVEQAVKNSGKLIPSQVVTISTDGKILK